MMGFAAAPTAWRCAAKSLSTAGTAASSIFVSVSRGKPERSPVPCTSIYSKSDGLVPWELCVETETAQAENIEIEGATHRGLPAHPKVLEVITHRLAQPEGEWRPFDSKSPLAFN
jgi:hypothetical protein